MTPEEARERNKIAVRKYRERHPERVKAQLRAYYASPEGKSKTREKNLRYRLEHPDRAREAYREWQAANPEKTAQLRARRRARKAKSPGSHTAAEWKKICADMEGMCLYCWLIKGDNTTQNKLTVDHVIPLSLGGSDYADNIIPACGSCNSRKRNKSIERVMEEIATAILQRMFKTKELCDSFE